MQRGKVPPMKSSSDRNPGRRRRLVAALLLGAALVLSHAAVAGAAGPAGLGKTTLVFDPSTPVSQIQATVDGIHARQVDNEMGTERYALLFKPGVYGTDEQPLQMK